MVSFHFLSHNESTNANCDGSSELRFNLTAERATYFSVPYSTHAKMKNTVHEGNERGSDVDLRVRN